MAVVYLIAMDGRTLGARTFVVPRKVEELGAWWKAACKVLRLDVGTTYCSVEVTREYVRFELSPPLEGQIVIDRLRVMLT